jgi:class 3 adenylate cyclase
MSRLDCISNRNIKIIAAYVENKLGEYQSLFEGLPYPAKEYPSAEDFFLNEDEWTTFENFNRIFRNARELIDDPDFFFNCGASSARLRSWGRFHYFVRVFASPNDGFKKLPFFNKNFDDTKEIEIILPPAYDSNLRKIRTLIKIDFHSNFDPNKDYMGDNYTRGIISSIPTIWGMPPASIKQVLSPYNPEVLFNKEPELDHYGLDVRIERDIMSLRDPANGKRLIVGEKIFLEPAMVNGQKVFLGKYTKRTSNDSPNEGNIKEAILITETIESKGRILLTAGEIFMAPYFILEVSYDRFSPFHRLSQIFKVKDKPDDSGSELIETIDQLRRIMRAKNRAYLALEKSNAELIKAKAQLDKYALELEHKVEERTAELQKAQQDLLELNRDLESKVKAQVFELEKYNELRRYLSPKLTEKILTSGHTFGAEPQRKIMTVVFTDIRGFSNITDSLESEELFQLLDRYLSEMIKIIHRHDGTLNKIIGDGLLIFFGDPIPTEDHAERAVRMAMDMQRSVECLLDEWRQFGHELGIGIGINTGYVTVGNIGSDMHRDYTVIGNQVNVAARLESVAKAGEILISQRTYSKVKDLFEVKEMGEIQVKGIHSPLKTYNVVCK